MKNIYVNGKLKIFMFYKFTRLSYNEFFLLRCYIMANVFNYNNVKLDDLQIDKPKKEGQIYYSSIKYNNNPLFIQTSSIKIKDYKINKKTSSIQFDIQEDNLDLYDFFIKLDNKLIKETYNNSKNWFNQEIPLEVIDDFYRRLSKPLEKGKKPSIRFKVPMIENNIVCKIYNQKKEYIKLEDIKDNLNSILILHIKGIKFLKQQYICDCYITQMRVEEKVKIKYEIPEECLINIDTIYDSDEDILDQEMINELNKIKIDKIRKKEKLIEEKNKLLEKIKDIDLQINNINE